MCATAEPIARTAPEPIDILLTGLTSRASAAVLIKRKNYPSFDYFKKKHFFIIQHHKNIFCSNCEVKENIFDCNTVSFSFWFAVGTLMQQGSDLNPKVPSHSQ